MFITARDEHHILAAESLETGQVSTAKVVHTLPICGLSLT